MTTTKGAQLRESLLTAEAENQVMHIFKVQPNKLAELFKGKNMPKGDGEVAPNNQLLQDLGGARGLMAAVASNERTGITGDLKDI